MHYEQLTDWVQKRVAIVPWAGTYDRIHGTIKTKNPVNFDVTLQVLLSVYKMISKGREFLFYSYSGYNWSMPSRRQDHWDGQNVGMESIFPRWKIQALLVTCSLTKSEINYTKLDSYFARLVLLLAFKKPVGTGHRRSTWMAHLLSSGYSRNRWSWKNTFRNSRKLMN